MKNKEIIDHITNWLNSYCEESKQNGFIIGISGGIDSALTSTLCAQTGKKILVVSMPIRQRNNEYHRALKHITFLENNYQNVTSLDIDLTQTFEIFEKTVPMQTFENKLAMANSRSRLRMTTLYAIGQANGLLVAGTGNKIEDFGVGFYTKYGDGGVDLSPIADLTKTQVGELAKQLNIDNEILNAEPTDGLWDEDGRNDENQMGASYPELEWAMEYIEKKSNYELTIRQKEILSIYTKLNKQNRHKMTPIPVCNIPKELFY
jgi:NAD+ synthase